MTAQQTINKQVLILSQKLSVENKIKNIQELLKQLNKDKEKLIKIDLTKNEMKYFKN